jgi:hypothetical protein
MNDPLVSVMLFPSFSYFLRDFLDVLQAKNAKNSPILIENEWNCFNFPKKNCKIAKEDPYSLIFYAYRLVKDISAYLGDMYINSMDWLSDYRCISSSVMVDKPVLIYSVRYLLDHLVLQVFI